MILLVNCAERIDLQIAAPHRRPGGFDLLPVLLLAAVALTGCDRNPVDRNRAWSLDSDLVDVDRGGWETRFESRSDPIRLGTGWHTATRLPEPINQSGWSSAAAWFYTPDLEDRDAVLELELTPVDHPQLRPQSLKIQLNGKPLETVALAAGEQTVEVPVPAARLSSGLNTFKIRFDRYPTLVDLGYSQIPWALPAKFTAIRLLPVAASSETRIQTPEAQAQGDTVVIPAGGSMAIPLPYRAGARVTFEDVEASAGASLSISVVDVDGVSNTLWQGSGDNIDGLELEVDSGGDLARRLMIRNETAANGQTGDVSNSMVTIPADSMRLENLPPTAVEDGVGRPHIFIYLLDTLRADALGVYGAGRPTSPNIDRFARDSIVFDRAWSPSAWTLPSVYSLLTGVYPFRHGFIWAGVKRRPDFEVDRLPELLRAFGYRSTAISQTFLASEVYGTQTGFEQFYVDDWLGSFTASSQRIGWYLWRALLHHGDLSRPFFAYIHTVDPHEPYTPSGPDRRFAEETPGTLPPEAYSHPQLWNRSPRDVDAADVAHLRALYDGGVAYADRQFGRFIDLLRHLNLYDSSVIILTSDHGEEFFEHGGFDHGRTLYEELLHIPLIVKLPHGYQAGARLSTRASLVDITPTVLALAGLKGSLLDSFDGIDLAAAVTNPRQYKERLVYAHTSPEPQEDLFAEVSLTAAVSDNLKCIESATRVDRFFAAVPRFRSYDLEVDPQERDTLPGSDEGGRACTRRLGEWTKASIQTLVSSGDHESLSAEELARLKTLGYLD
ncbi:MAG: sulfatase [Acidobacteriota bacterium]